MGYSIVRTCTQIRYLTYSTLKKEAVCMKLLITISECDGFGGGGRTRSDQIDIYTAVLTASSYSLHRETSHRRLCGNSWERDFVPERGTNRTQLLRWKGSDFSKDRTWKQWIGLRPPPFTLTFLYKLLFLWVRIEMSQTAQCVFAYVRACNALLI